MPTIFNAFGYKIYIWSNENGEPIHVHICRGPHLLMQLRCG